MIDPSVMEAMEDEVLLYEYESRELNDEDFDTFMNELSNRKHDVRTSEFLCSLEGFPLSSKFHVMNNLVFARQSDGSYRRVCGLEEWLLDGEHIPEPLRPILDLYHFVNGLNDRTSWAIFLFYAGVRTPVQIEVKRNDFAGLEETKVLAAAFNALIEDDNSREFVTAIVRLETGEYVE